MIKFLKSLLHRILNDNISFLAGGVAFYGMLALFPALAGIVSLFGLVASTSAVNEQLLSVQALFPPDVFKIIQEQMSSLTTQSGTSLSLTVIFSLLLTIYSSTKGTNAMLAALNMVFRVNETRSWFRLQIIAYALTFGALLLMILAVLLVVAVPIVMHFLPDYVVENFSKPVDTARWLILSSAVFAGLFTIFAFGPNRSINSKCFRSIFWGAFVATAIWIAAAVGGSMLIQFFPNANAAYGSLSAIVALMMWIYISAYTVLIGSAITAEGEAITCQAPKQSNAVIADFRALNNTDDK